jgi:glycosyltransferase involved in cell wall biosynthesis
MKIKMQQFMGSNHSWSTTGRGIARGLKLLNNEVEIFSTNGIEHFPDDLKPNLIGYVEENQPKVFGRVPSNDYDAQISYTSMKNFPIYFSHGKKNRIGIWCYEFKGKNVLPNGFAKHHNNCDVLCPPSEFAKQVFLESNIPENKIKIIPHGIDAMDYKKTSTIQLPTNKKFKILANIAQNHIRKNIPGLLTAYGSAFNIADDVCLILKAKERKPTNTFDISLNDCLNDFRQKFPKHGEVKILSNFIVDMSDLYRSVDATFTMSFCEAFYYVALESIAAGKLAIAPNYGGQLDFLNADNSLLIDGKEEQANPKSMYWEQKSSALWFKPSIDDAVDKLRYAYNNFETMNAVIEKDREKVYQKFDWSNISKQYLDLCTV